MLSVSTHLEAMTVAVNLTLLAIHLKPVLQNQKKSLMICAQKFSADLMLFAILDSVCVHLDLKETTPMIQQLDVLPFQNANMTQTVATMRSVLPIKMDNQEDVLMLVAEHLVDPMHSV